LHFSATQAVSATEARHSSSPSVALGKVVIPRQDLNDETVKKGVDTMDGLSFKPCNRWDERQRRSGADAGDVNDARKAVYEASSKNRGSGGVNDHRCPIGLRVSAAPGRLTGRGCPRRSCRGW
jgi:hypothetical protein